MIKFASIVLSGFVLTVTVAPVRATSLVFASFTQTSGAQDFTLTTSALKGSATDLSVTIKGSGEISFAYMIGGTPFTGAAQTAKLQFTVTSIVSGNCPSPTPNCLANNAPFAESGYSGSFAITRDSPFDGPSGGHSNLLSGTFNLLSPGAQLTSALTSTSATLEATGTSSNPNQVVFTSDFLNFANTINRDATFSFTSLTSLVKSLTGFSVITNTVTDNRFPNDFSALGTGTFAEDLVQIPEPSTLGLLASGLLAFCLWQRKRRLLHR